MATSPYRVALGDAFDGLHPRLMAYFDGIPEGGHGFGRGVFDTVGTPRRWLWPALWLLARAHVVFPVWQRDVPFTVSNVPDAAASGAPSVRAVRVFRFATGRRAMVDEIAVDGRTIVDTLGRPARVSARFDAAVVDGGLVLTSTAVAFLLGRARIPVPAPIAPRVVLSERYDDDVDAQRVSITLDLPVVGRLYEYAGTFRYVIEQGERTA
ncbi:DUF4166 domain-containing protein [Leifsonia lichenia]